MFQNQYTKQHIAVVNSVNFFLRMKVNVNLFTWLKEKKGKKNTQIFFFTMWCWRIQTFGVVLKTRKRCRSVFTVIHVSHSCKTAVWTIKMLLRSLLWFSDFFFTPQWLHIQRDSVISMSRDQFAIQAYIGKISKKYFLFYFFKPLSVLVHDAAPSPPRNRLDQKLQTQNTEVIRQTD